MYGHCKKCGKIFGSLGTNDRDGKLIMFEECEHETPRDNYKVISFQESISCGADNFNLPNLQNRLKQFQLEAQKENKNLWIQLLPTDLRTNPKKPEDVSRTDIRFSMLPYQMADVVTLVFDMKTEMRLAHRYKIDNEALKRVSKRNLMNKEVCYKCKDKGWVQGDKLGAIGCPNCSSEPQLDYEELVEELKKQTKTYLPGLMVELLKLCLKNKVFKDNDPIPFVKKVIKGTL